MARTSFRFVGFLIFLIVGVVWPSPLVFSQEKPVEARGSGPDRAAAIRDACRLAVEQACGTTIRSQTRQENFLAVSDVIVSRAEGYISHFELIEETQTEQGVEVLIQASVTLKALEMDARLLEGSVGNLLFGICQEGNQKDPDLAKAFDQVHRALIEKWEDRHLRFMEKRAFHCPGSDQPEPDTKGINRPDFVLVLSDLHIRKEKKGAINQVKLVGDARITDIQTGQILAGTQLESAWAFNPDLDVAIGLACRDVAKKGAVRLLDSFLATLADWTNQGVPYDVKFALSSPPESMNRLLGHLKTDPLFGGLVRPPSLSGNQWELTLAYRESATVLAEKLRAFFALIPEFEPLSRGNVIVTGRRIECGEEGNNPGTTPNSESR